MTNRSDQDPGGAYPPGKHPNSLANLRRGDRASGQAARNGVVTARVREKLLRQVGGRNVAEELADVMIQKAQDGDFRFFKEILDRTDRRSADAGESAAAAETQRTIEAIMKDPQALKLARRLAERLGELSDSDDSE